MEKKSLKIFSFGHNILVVLHYLSEFCCHDDNIEVYLSAVKVADMGLSFKTQTIIAAIEIFCNFVIVNKLLQDVLSVAFSVDNRQIVSGSRDKTIKLWNTLAECKYTIQEDGHSDWVSE